MNSLGLVAAVSAFLAIWFGHVAVRKIEFVSATLRVPALIFFSFGIAAEWLSLVIPVLPVSSALGIVGITLLWDSLELGRQERRVRRGHAPANPHNPRHATFLAEPGARATTIDLLKQAPENKTPMSLEERGIIY